jgi:hypothetical protein
LAIDGGKNRWSHKLDFREAGADCPGLFSVHRAMIGMKSKMVENANL